MSARSGGLDPHNRSGAPLYRRDRRVWNGGGDRPRHDRDGDQEDFEGEQRGDRGGEKQEQLQFPVRSKIPVRSKKRMERIVASRPLTKEIHTIFNGRCNLQAAEEFLRQHRTDSNCNAVILADFISRLSKEMCLVGFKDHERIAQIFPVLDLALESFNRRDLNCTSRELSTCIRVIGRYYDHCERLRADIPNRAELLLRARSWYQRLVGRWNRILQFNPSIVDCTEVIAGMAANRELFRHSGSSRQADTSELAVHLRSTCEYLASRLQSSPEAIGSKEAVHLINLMSHMVDNSILSRNLSAIINQQLWMTDQGGCTPMDRIEEFGGSLTFKIKAVYAAASQGIKDVQRLESVERDFEGFLLQAPKDRGALAREVPKMTDMLGEFLAAALLHHYKPSAHFLRVAEKYLNLSLNRNWISSALYTHSANYAAIALLLLVDRPEFTTLRIADSLAQKDTENPSSKKENEIAKALKILQDRGVLQFKQAYRFDPIHLDFYVNIPARGKYPEKKIDLEIDGFPYHAVYDIDRGGFDSSTQNPLDFLRDRLVKERAELEVIRVDAATTDFMTPLQIAIKLGRILDLDQ